MSYSIHPTNLSEGGDRQVALYEVRDSKGHPVLHEVELRDAKDFVRLMALTGDRSLSDIRDEELS